MNRNLVLLGPDAGVDIGSGAQGISDDGGTGGFCHRSGNGARYADAYEVILEVVRSQTGRGEVFWCCSSLILGPKDRWRKKKEAKECRGVSHKQTLEICWYVSTGRRAADRPWSGCLEFSLQN